MKITRAQGDGQGQCALWKKRGKWNVQWMTFLYKVDGVEGVYCKSCANEIRLQIYVEGKRRFEQEHLELECTNPND